MPVKIRFRGPMLFVVHEAHVDVLIPRSEYSATGHHADWSKAVPHFAWLASWRDTKHNGLPVRREFEAREELSGVAVTITDDKGGKPAKKHFQDTFDFTPIAGALTMPKPNPSAASGIAAVVRLYGGMFSENERSKRAWRWSDVLNRDSDNRPTIVKFVKPVVELAWRSEGKVTTTLTFEQGHTKNVSLGSDSEVTVQIGNLDQRGPESWPKDVPEMEPDRYPAIDHDFKWIYSMFADVEWDPILLDPETGGRFGLPAPMVRSDSGAGITSSCNSGTVYMEDILARSTSSQRPSP